MRLAPRHGRTLAVLASVTAAALSATGTGSAGAASASSTIVPARTASCHETSPPAERPRPATPSQDERPSWDVRIGAPLRDVGGVTDAGAVEVRSAEGADHLLTSPEPQEGERFGSAIAESATDGMLGPPVVTVGAPGLTVAGKADAGGVYVFRQAEEGLCFVTLLTQDHPDIPGEAQENAQFGASLAASIWEDDATEPVLHFVGAPGLDVADVPGAGGLVQLEVDWDEDIDELTISGRLHTVESPHPGDHLGATVETSGSTWYAGAPDATVGDVPEAGLVAEGDVNQTGAAKVHHQGADGVQGAPESGDRFGAALAAGSDDRMWVGVPGEDLGTVDDAGMINGIGAHKRAFTQNTADDGSGKPVEGTAEAGDQFGTALLQVPDGTGLLVGVPGEDIRHVADAGSATGLFGHPSHSQETTGGTVTEGSRFGTAIGSTEGPIFGAPGTNDGAGAVYLRPTQDSDWTMWTLRVDRPASGDRYGSAFEVRNGYHGCC